MLTFKRALASVALLSLASCSAAHMNFMNGETARVDGVYREGNLIRASANMSRAGSPQQAFNHALREIAEMTAARGFERFGVVKVSDCGTLMMNRTIPVANTCRLLARMVGPTENAEPEGNRPVVYYRTADVLAGPIQLPGR